MHARRRDLFRLRLAAGIAGALAAARIHAGGLLDVCPAAPGVYAGIVGIGQVLGLEQVGDFYIKAVGDCGLTRLEAVIASVIHVGIALHKQLVGIARVSAVAVGQVHQVVHTAHVHQVPHVQAGIAAGGIHVALDADDADILVELAHIAKVLEGLGVALADHLGVGIAVEHPHQLPRVAIGIITRPGGGVVVGGEIADGFLVAGQLVHVAQAGAAFEDLPRVLDGGLNGGRLGGIHLQRAGIAAGGIIPGDPELEFGHSLAAIINGVALAIEGVVIAGPFEAQRLVIPIQVIGTIHQERCENPIDPVLIQLQLFIDSRLGLGSNRSVFIIEGLQFKISGRVARLVVNRGQRYLQLRAGAFATGHFSNHRFDRKIDIVVDSRQPAARDASIGGPEHHPALLIDGHGAVDEAGGGRIAVKAQIRAGRLLLEFHPLGRFFVASALRKRGRQARTRQKRRQQQREHLPHSTHRAHLP